MPPRRDRVPIVALLGGEPPGRALFLAASAGARGRGGAGGLVWEVPGCARRNRHHKGWLVSLHPTLGAASKKRLQECSSGGWFGG